MGVVLARHCVARCLLQVRLFVRVYDSTSTSLVESQTKLSYVYMVRVSVCSSCC